MPSSWKQAKADIPDIHAESIEELREAFDLFDTKGEGTCSDVTGFGVNWSLLLLCDPKDLGYIYIYVYHTERIYRVVLQSTM